MDKRNLLNLGLLLLIGALVLLVLYEPGIEKPAENPSLLSLQDDAIQQIRIQRENQPDILLLRQNDGRWWMEQPIRHRVAAQRMTSLLRISQLRSLSSFAITGRELADYRLNKPHVRLTLNDDVHIDFGGSTPLDQRRYVRLNNTVHLISDTLYYHLIGDATTFLDKQLLDDKLSIRTLSLPSLLLKWQDEKWQLTPQPENFSADQIGRLIDNWRFAAALEIKVYDGKGGTALQIGFDDKAFELELLLTAHEPDLVLARPDIGIQYHFDASSAKQLLQLPSEETPEPEPEPEADHDEHGHSH